jgi:hypothetical protein
MIWAVWFILLTTNPWVHLDVSAYKSHVLHLCVSFYKSFVPHLDVYAYKSPFCTCACLSTRLHLDVSAYKILFCTCARLSTRVLCRIWTCLYVPARAQPMLFLKVYSLHKKKFRFVSVCFETDLLCFVSVVLIYVRNIETSRSKPKILFFAFVKQTEKQLKQIELRLFSVQTDICFFAWFEDNLTR